jgi:hypothetical protein
VAFSSLQPQRPLTSAALQLAHGLRPMEKAKQKAAYVPAQRSFLFVFFRTAHCLPGHYTIKKTQVNVLSLNKPEGGGRGFLNIF